MKESGEDYLETIYLLSRKKGEVHSIDIANELNFSKPSVTRAVKLLQEMGYLVKDEYNHIKLTQTGIQKASAVYERHQILTRFLVLNGISEEVAAKDACRMEHDLSEESFSKIKEIVLKTPV